MSDPNELTQDELDELELARARADSDAAPRLAASAGPVDLTPEQKSQFKTIGQPSTKERVLGSIVSTASGSPLFNTVAKAAASIPQSARDTLASAAAYSPFAAIARDFAAGGAAKPTQVATQATEQFSPKVAGVPVLPVVGGVLSTLPAGAARIGGTALGIPLNTARASMAGRVGLQGLLGGATAADRGGDAGDIAAGATIGVAGGLLGEGGGALAGAAAKRLGSAATNAAARARAIVEQARQKALASEVSALGGLGAAEVRALEVAREALKAPRGMYTPAELQQAQQFINKMAAAGNIGRALNNALDKGRSAFSAEPAQRAAVQAAEAAATPQAIDDATAAALRPGELASDLVGRAWRSIGQRALLAAGGAAVGGVLGGPLGAGAGALTGGIAPGALQMLRNVAKAPKFQYAAASMGEGAASALASSAPYLSPALRPTAQSILTPRPGPPGPVAAPQGELRADAPPRASTLKPEDEASIEAYLSAP